MRCLLLIALVGLIPLYGLGAEADSSFVKPGNGKVFNWGAKVGFNSVLPVINSFLVDDMEVGRESSVEYKVGYMAALFCRLNFDRFFIQPSLSLHRNESDIYFRLPDDLGTSGVPVKDRSMDKQLYLKIYSIDMPVMIGYSIVKEGPFGLSVMAGGKARYNYKYDIQYINKTDNYKERYTGDSSLFRVNMIGGVGVTLWQLFFDFTYEVGLNHREAKFKETKNNPDSPNNIVLDKRLNMMGFSLGFLF